MSKWLDEKGKVVTRVRDRHEGESRRQRVRRHIEELANEAGIEPEKALARLRSGDPAGKGEKS